jgi:hypothetical protein
VVKYPFFHGGHMKRIVFLAILFFVTGCASVPDIQTAPKVAADSILDATLTSPHDGAGEVTIKRDSWPLHAYKLGVYSDGTRIAEIGNGEVLTVYLPLGRRLIGVGQSSAGKPESEIPVEVQQSKESFVHLTLSAWGWGGWNIAQSSY